MRLDDALLERYTEWLKDKVKSRSLPNYKSTAYLFADFINKDILDIENLKKYFEMVKKENSKSHFNNIYAHIDKLLIYLNEQGIINFSIKDVKLTKFSRREIQSDSVNKATSLNFDDIYQIRDIIRKYPALLFTFEMTYSEGLSLDQLAQCAESYNQNTRSFVVKAKDNEEITMYMNYNIHQIIMSNLNILKPKGVNVHQKRFARIKELYEKKTGQSKNISWDDVSATRRELFFKCSICEKLYENISEYWAVAKIVEDNSLRIVCRSCCEGREEMNGDKIHG